MNNQPPVIHFSCDREPELSGNIPKANVGTSMDLYPDVEYRRKIMAILKGEQGDKNPLKGFHTYKEIRYRILPVRTKDGGVHPYAYLLDGNGTSFGEKGKEINFNEIRYTPQFGSEVENLQNKTKGHIEENYAK